MGFPQQPQQPPQQFQQAPGFQQPYAQALAQQQPQQPQGFVTQDQLASAVELINGLSNQVAQLTGAVNGLGANQEALHNWLVAQANNISTMISSIANSIKTEGALGFLKGMLGGAPQPMQPPTVQQQPQFVQQQPQQFPQGFPPGV